MNIDLDTASVQEMESAGYKLFMLINGAQLQIQTWQSQLDLVNQKIASKKQEPAPKEVNE